MHRVRTVAVGILLSLLYTAGDVAISLTTDQNKEPAAHTDTNQTSEGFQFIKIGEGRAPDGTRLGFRTYAGSKGTIVSIMYGTFPSIEASKAELNLWIRMAKKVVERAEKKNSQGEVVGESVLLTLTDSRAGADYPVVAWTSGVDFFEIKAFSLPAVLHFEERINKGMPLEDGALSK